VTDAAPEGWATVETAGAVVAGVLAFGGLALWFALGGRVVPAALCAALTLGTVGAGYRLFA
jgi:hypothetical protein